jgi:hypothetical protein
MKTSVFYETEIVEKSKFSLQYFAGNNYIMNAGKHILYVQFPRSLYNVHVLL